MSTTPVEPSPATPAAPWRRAADALAAVAVLTLTLLDQAATLFQRDEWVDWIAYALPAANVLGRGTFATPQLGDQFGLDRFWLWNSPLMGLGPLPFYAAFGVSRTAYLLGCLLLSAVVVVVTTVLMRSALGLRSWALAAVVGYAVLGTQTYYVELGNQRYCVIVVAALAYLFFPAPAAPHRAGTSPARWALAGVLPLLHPSLLFASALWVIGEALPRALDRWRGRRTPVPWAGLALFAAGVVACAAWYLRPEPLRLQFLPQARSISARSGLVLGVSKLFGVPTYAGYALIVASAVAAVFAGRGRATTEPGLVRAGLTVLVALALELARGFVYMPYYLMGLAPAVFCVWRPTSLRTAVTVALVAVALMNAAVASRFATFRYPLTHPAAERAFIVGQTRPGDRIVLGPPLVLAAASTDWPEGRSVRFVVPQPYILAAYDDARFRASILEGSDVYVGEEKSYFFTDSRQYYDNARNGVGDRAALFPGAEVTRARLGGRDLLIVRSNRPQPRRSRQLAP